MGIFKLFINLSLCLLLFGNCNKPKKQKTAEIVSIKVDTIPKTPKYLTKNYVLGKFDYTKNADFVLVPKELSNKKIYLRKEVLEAFLEMKKTAEKEKITFKIISGTRNFSHQKRIWNYKWNTKYKTLPPLKRAKKILEFSSMPSTSRHHWGTDLDINSLNNSYFTKGTGLKEYNWLLKNASKFGFYQVYTSKENGRTGYYEEKWHWTFLPLSSTYLNYYNTHITLNDIGDFEGSEYAKELNIIKNYVNGVNLEILKP
ncbi:M15 family metallopeptidase [Polaribacter pectinis]|uniref:M15 family metallopeptidase n=1 Tax=Polaribacter pectinis TaxID=2738844 RepID=A0A7G9LAQ7_9FLAO|nr:M15 family metallopeptidase [Polaribacter pectinis]QNM85706.1 M15 family metallopeptidase [Polaribacter pectinis]